ncbi:hypothetical protein F0562_025298 [Nyssa sinensis]|uniref:Uncharacterized protein n=1 Tax=Nyssa sinensis TaxID=561372 RepID=A0A5J5BDV2_9ASTE|nr:hypothetical protein F0562_025298 [Nyssa sinensis]
MNDPAPHPPHNVQASMDDIECAGGKSKIPVKEKRALKMVGNTPTFSSHLDAETVAMPNEFMDKDIKTKMNPILNPRAAGPEGSLIPGVEIIL